jgi:hypothetical protein
VKVENIDAEKLALFVEAEMERRLSWSSNALYIATRPPRAVVRDEEAVDDDRGKSEAARAVRLLHAFVVDSEPAHAVAAELALRFLWRWIYAPPFMSTSRADAAPLEFVSRVEADDDDPLEERQLAYLMYRAGWILARAK